MNLILMGPPGAGKGTQAKLICEKLSIPAISTGNILRDAAKSGTAKGNEIKAIIDAGNLVPDDIILDIIRERIAKDDCLGGFLLDGFPRTIPQAKALDEMGVEINKVVSIEVEDEAIINRMSKRRICDKCGASYHLDHKKPHVEGVCDDCGGKLICRKDDAPETVKDRLSVYHKTTEPLISYYEQSGRICKVDGRQSMEDVFSDILSALEL